MSRTIQHKHHGNLPAVDGEGPAKIPRGFCAKDLRDAASAALRRRGVTAHPWNGRPTKKAS